MASLPRAGLLDQPAGFTNGRGGATPSSWS
jgi:hypothetical protein